MNALIEFMSQSWHWFPSGLALAAIVFSLYWLGERFGISSSYESLCTIAGAGKNVSYFDKDWKKGAWKLVFAGGAIVGGFIASTLLSSPEPIQLASSTVTHLNELGINAPQSYTEFIPTELFGIETLTSIPSLLLLIVGGFLVGFGTRYAGGCTSGHAISGLSELHWQSFLAVIGFFIGGIFTTYLILPILLG